MSYKNPCLKSLVGRGATRSCRHGNWRQIYIDCAGVCIARVNGSDIPCGDIDQLELHEVWGEGDSKFQQRVCLCNLHHSLIEDRAHQADFMLDQYRPSRMALDANLEILLAGGYDAWVKKWELDSSRFGCLLFSGPQVGDYE